jgi:hypothetical protein
MRPVLQPLLLMMKTLVLAVTSLLFLMAPMPRAQAQANVDVSIDFFYDALQPYGDWIYVEGYGYCWEPYPELVGDGWQPYTDGYWAYTDGGWTWITDEPFGWATYHYGRWMQNYGRWCWVPGYEWAPSWVSWRQSDEFIGWAPLPPEASWSVSVGFGIWTDSYYDIGPGWYNFVPHHLFACRSSLRPFVLNRYNNVTYIDRSVNITNISYNRTVVNNIFVGGPDVNRFDRLGRDRVPRYSLRRDDDGLRRDWLNRDGDRDPRNLSRVDRDQLIVASPNIRRDERAGLPSRVRERFAQPEIDRGWRSAGNSDQSSRLRSQREQEERNLPKNLPERRPVIATSTTPPPAVGRTLSLTERRSFGPGSSRSSAGETPRAMPVEVRKATPVDTADQPPATRTGSTPSDSRSRFGRADALPIPGSQRPDVSDRGAAPSRNPSTTAEGRPAMPGSSFKKADEVRPAIPSSPFGSRPGIPPTSRPPETKPEVRPSTPSRPSFTPPSSSRFTPPPSSRSDESKSRPSFTPPSGSRFTPPSSSRSNAPQSRPSFTPPPRPSTPQPSAPQSRPSFTPPSRPSTPSFTPPQRPSFTPPSSSRSSAPQSRPSFTPPPRPSTPSITPQQRPSFTPPSSSRPSAPQSRPSFTPSPRPSAPAFTPQQRPSFTPPSSSRSSAPQSRPSFTPSPRPSTPQPSGPSAGDPRGRRGRG